MGRREQFTVGELTIAGITQYIGASVATVLQRDAYGSILLAAGTTVPARNTAGYAKGAIFVKSNAAAGIASNYINKGTSLACEFVKPGLQVYAVVPSLIVADRYFASAAMHNGAYAVANGGLPGDGLAHNVTVAQTAVDAEDTNGTLTVAGLDINGDAISEVIIPNAGVTVQGAKAFAAVTSITGSGWVTGGGADTIVIGFGEVLGLPHKIAAVADVLLVGFNTALVNAPTVVAGATLAECTVAVPTGDGTKALRVIYQI